MYFAYPVKNAGSVVGIIYLVASMENIYDTIANTKTILFMATVLGLIVTGVLGMLFQDNNCSHSRITKAASLAQEILTSRLRSNLMMKSAN